MKPSLVLTLIAVIVAALTSPAAAHTPTSHPAWIRSQPLDMPACGDTGFLDVRWRVDLADGLEPFDQAPDQTLHTTTDGPTVDGEATDDQVWVVPAANVVSTRMVDEQGVVIYRAIYPTHQATFVHAWIDYGDAATDQLALGRVRCIDPVSMPVTTSRYRVSPSEPADPGDDESPDSDPDDGDSPDPGDGESPDPDEEEEEDSEVVVPATDGALLVAGPFLEPGVDYTGQQLGGWYRDGDGEPFSFGWPSPTRPQGQFDHGWAGIEAIEEDMMRLTLSRAGRGPHAATTAMEQHVPLDRTDPTVGGHQRVSLTFDVAHRSGEPFRTMKNPGLVGFNNPDWSQWPGGGRHGAENFSVRVVHNSDDGHGPRWSAYLYLGVPTSPDDFTYTGSPDPRVVVDNKSSAGRGHVIEVVARNGPAIKPDTLYTVRLEVDAGTPGQPDGSLRYLVREEGGEWVEVMELTELQWAAHGAGLWTRSYSVVAYGGVDESFAPQNASQTGVVDLGRIQVHQLADQTSQSESAGA